VTSADGTVIGYTRRGDGPRVVRGLMQGSVPAGEIGWVLAALGRNQLRQPGPLGQRHHLYQARNSRNRPEVQVTEGAAHVTQSWSTCSDGNDHASRNGEKQ
jgi:hypothetical protein